MTWSMIFGFGGLGFLAITAVGAVLWLMREHAKLVLSQEREKILTHTTLDMKKYVEDSGDENGRYEKEVVDIFRHTEPYGTERARELLDGKSAD